MNSLELATWFLAVLTGVLTFATLYYAIITHKMLNSSRKTQKVLEYQNIIMSSHNDLLSKQIDALQSQASAMHSQTQVLGHLITAISELPSDAQEIKDKLEKKRLKVP